METNYFILSYVEDSMLLDKYFVHLKFGTTNFFYKNQSIFFFNRPMMFMFKCLKILDNFILFFHPIFL
jgi:hypothetical protein